MSRLAQTADSFPLALEYKLSQVARAWRMEPYEGQVTGKYVECVTLLELPKRTEQSKYAMKSIAIQ